MVVEAVAAAFRSTDPETLELEARCILTEDHVDANAAFEQVVRTLENASCWDAPLRRYERVDRFFDGDVRVSDFSNGEQMVAKKTTVVKDDLPPESEFWKAPADWPRFRISLSREYPTSQPKGYPNFVRRKQTASCTYKQQAWRFDVSKVVSGNQTTLELEVECQTLDMDPDLLQRSLLMKLADLAQMASG